MDRQNPVVLTEADFQLLRPYMSRLNENDEMSLAHELKRAIIVQKDAFPAHGIGINSKVVVVDLDTENTSELIIVMPEFADIKQRKVSVLAPLATALIGFRKGEAVTWKMPGGIRHFYIKDVINQSV